MGLTNTPNDQLMRAMSFSIKDLDTNQDGLLTAGQAKRIKQWQLRRSAVTIAITLIILVAIILMSRDDRMLAPLQFWVVMGGSLPVALWLFRFQQRTLCSLTRGKVASIHGRVRVIQDLQSYLVEINGTKLLRLKRGFCDAFVTGETYTLYYLPVLDVLLSAQHHASAASRQVMGQHVRSMQKRDMPVGVPYESRPKWRGKNAIAVHDDRGHIQAAKTRHAPVKAVRDVRPMLKQRFKERGGR
jgi:hypothetical protein